MEKNFFFALLLHNQESLFASLRTALEGQRIKIREAHSCAEALPLVTDDNPPQVIFSSSQLPDGTWADVVDLAARASKPARVVVVSRLADLKLYLDVLEGGAFDFIAPPFLAADLAHIVQSAARGAAAMAPRPKHHSALRRAPARCLPPSELASERRLTHVSAERDT